MATKQTQKGVEGFIEQGRHNGVVVKQVMSKDKKWFCMNKDKRELRTHNQAATNNSVGGHNELDESPCVTKPKVTPYKYPPTNHNVGRHV